MDVVDLCASDPDLIRGVITPLFAESGKKEDVRKSIAGRIKERVALKEVNNVLEAQSISFKPNRVGIKPSRGSASREVGPAVNWGSFRSKSETPGQILQGQAGTKPDGGPVHSHPPEPSPLMKVSSLPILNQISRREGDGSEEEKHSKDDLLEDMEHDASVEDVPGNISMASRANPSP